MRQWLSYSRLYGPLETYSDRSFPLDTIARAAGVNEPVLSRMVRGKHARVTRSTAAAVRAVTYKEVLAAAPDLALVPSLGARRRLHSLMALGWPVWQQAGQCETTADTLQSITRYDRWRVVTEGPGRMANCS